MLRFLFILRVAAWHGVARRPEPRGRPCNGRETNQTEALRSALLISIFPCFHRAFRRNPQGGFCQRGPQSV